MKLQVYSFQNDVLELEIDEIRPQVTIAEIYFDGVWHPWNAYWQDLVITKFHEDNETVKNKVIQFYKAECSEGVRSPNEGSVVLLSEHEQWTMPGAKIVKFTCDEEVSLTIRINTARYEAIKK